MFKSIKDILKIGNGNPVYINKAFNMSHKEFDIFSNTVDERFFAEKMVCELSANNETKRLNPEMIQFYKEQQKAYAVMIQSTLLSKVIIPGIREQLKSEKFNFERFVDIGEEISYYIKVTGINKEEIPEIEEYNSLINKCWQRNNSEFLRDVNELKNNEGKVNLFKLKNVIDTHVLAFDGTTEKAFSIITGKDIKMEEAKDVLTEIRNFYKEKTNDQKEQYKYRFIDCNMFSFEKENNGDKPKTFYRRFIDNVIRTKRITLEQVKEIKVEKKITAESQQAKEEKGEESIEK